MERLSSSISDNIKRIKHEIAEAAVLAGRDPADVRLMAVTKTVPASAVNEAVRCGINLIGENKAQELLQKYGDYDKPNMEIHFIGYLQSNKVNKIIDKVTMIHSVDRMSLAEEIARQAGKLGKATDILIEVNIGGEDSKSGVSPEALPELLEQIARLEAVNVRGLMTIPPVCDEIIQIERYFYSMQQLLVDMRAKKIDNVHMDILSMGMSGDYIPAVKHGANIIRVGTAIFGQRNYA